MAIRAAGGDQFCGVPRAAVWFLLAEYPAIRALNASANAVLRVAGLNAGHAHDAPIRQRIEAILRTSHPDVKFRQMGAISIPAYETC